MEQIKTEEPKLQPTRLEQRTTLLSRRVGRISKPIQQWEPAWHEWCSQPRPQGPTWDSK
jgi:hypothetical protein